MREPPTGGNYYGQFVFDAEREYPTSLFLFEYNGVPFSPLGGIQAISGQKKNGKTFFMTMLMACALEPDSERVRAKLPGLRLREDALEALGHMLVVMHFIPNPYNKKYVDHINTNIHDNRAENLRWVTAEENFHNPLSLVHYYQSKKVPFIVEWTDGDVHGSFIL